MSSPPSFVWFLLLESETGQSYNGTNAEKVSLSFPADVADFRSAVQVKYDTPNYLKDIPSSTLLVFKNKTAFHKRNSLDHEEREYPLKSSHSIVGLGSSEEEEDMLVVVVPRSRISGDEKAMKRSASDESTESTDRKRIKLDVLTHRFNCFVRASLKKDIISSDEYLPYPKDTIKKIFIRRCYVDVFESFLTNILDGETHFGISGTPGVGKSLFFLYILYRVMKGDSSLKPKRIVYQSSLRFKVFNISERTVVKVDESEAENLVTEAGDETLYLIDGFGSDPIESSCTTLFICSPRSDHYQQYCKQMKATEWYFPVWSLEELQACRMMCYPGLSQVFLKNRYLMFGGVARFIFWPWTKKVDGNGIPSKLAVALEIALTNKAQVNNVLPAAQLSHAFTNTSHSLVQIVVNESFQYVAVDAASDYVAHELCVRHYEGMIANLQALLGGGPNVLSRHLFEIYGHRVFSKGGMTLKCKGLHDGIVFDLRLDKFDTTTATFGRYSIPVTLPTSYYETTDDDSFPAIDSFSPQGMFQFTVGSDHPIRGVQVLKRICKLFEAQNKDLRLFFVVPPRRFDSFKKQVFKGVSGNTSVDEIEGLKQYVLELPVGI